MSSTWVTDTSALPKCEMMKESGPRWPFWE
jgi:hypothetical protein